MLTLAFVDLAGGGAEAPEGLQAEFAIDDLVVFVLRLVEEAAELGECAEGIGALRPGAAFGLLCAELVGQEKDTFFSEFDVRGGPNLSRRFTPVRAARQSQSVADVGLS